MRIVSAEPTSTGLSLFWGKARPVGGTERFHPLLAHCLDVAATGSQLSHRHPPLIAASTVAFLAALHDIGKFSPAFQAKVPDLWPTALGPRPAMPPADLGHDTTGLALLRERDIASRLDPVLPGWRDGDRVPLLAALTGHHGRPPRSDWMPSRFVLTSACRAAVATFVDLALRLFRPEPIPRPTDERAIARLAWQFAGFITLADWIGSAEQWFPYAAPTSLDDADAYLDRATGQARRAVTEAGLAPGRPAPFTGARGLFPTIRSLAPCQAWAEAVPLPSGPALFVIEDLTGSGKTEAALILAHRLIAAGRADGLFIGLPTMATANAMFERMAAAYRRLFAPGENPSLALAHGRAALNAGFSDALLRGAAGPAAAPATVEAADEPAGAQCAAWLADDRRRALLAEVGVGTIDQALLAALPVRHAPLRLQGLCHKVLVIDEAHAFDPYMRREVVALLRFQAALGGPAVLLSATLPRSVRQLLANAFRDGLAAAPAELSSNAYPLATVVHGAAVVENPCAPRAEVTRRIRVTRLDDAAAAVRRIAAAAAAGAAVAWVRNTVDDAIAGAEALRQAGCTPLLFHVRFAMCDRLRIEAEVLRRFGRGNPADRAGVLVATQVIEQSLDLDFDLLATELAPVDLLIQRAGRLWRHQRAPRPIDGPELLVISPAPCADPPADWISRPQPGTAAVYRDPALLWRSARAIFANEEMAAPEDMRALIEAADAAEVPPGLQAAADRAAGKAKGQAAVAAMNVLDVWAGYRRDAGAWDNDVATPTRLEDRPQVTLRLARVRDGRIVPYAEDADPARAWALSEVGVAEHFVSLDGEPDCLAEMAAEARKSWSKWEQESSRLKLGILHIDQFCRYPHQTSPPMERSALYYCRGMGLFFRRSRLRDEPVGEVIHTVLCSSR